MHLNLIMQRFNHKASVWKPTWWLVENNHLLYHKNMYLYTVSGADEGILHYA